MRWSDFKRLEPHPADFCGRAAGSDKPRRLQISQLADGTGRTPMVFKQTDKRAMSKEFQ
jgi:hypothetical protein